MWLILDDLKEPPCPSILCTFRAECHSLSSNAPSPGTWSCRRGQGRRGCIWIKLSIIIEYNKMQDKLTHIPTTQRQQQRAQARVLGPDLVLVLTWCWHEWHVRSTWDTNHHTSQLSGNIEKRAGLTGPSLSWVGTTSWVATAGGALCTGPTSEI